MGISGDHFFYPHLRYNDSNSVFRTELKEKMQNCQKYKEIYWGKEKYLVDDGVDA